MVVSTRWRLKTYFQNSSRLAAIACASFCDGPDINLIKNLWKQMGDAVKARHAAALKGLKQIIKDEWKKISLESIQNLYKSYPFRPKQIVERNGSMSDY